MPYSEKLSSMTLFSSMIYRVSHAIPVGMLLDIWLGIVKQGGKRMHHYLLSMMKLLEKYYNILYYCEYNLLFLIFKRILNPFYWLSLPKWNNKYMKCIVSRIEKQEVSEIHGGVNVFISSWATFAISCTSFWLLCITLIVGGKVLKMLGIGVPIAIFEYKFILLLLLISLIFYLCYINELFVFKKDKYRKYFAEFDKKKKYLLYYSIYVVSLVVQLATFYLLLMEIVK